MAYCWCLGSPEIPTLPLLDIFIDTARDVDYDLIKQVVKDNIIVVASANDSIVPTELTDQFAKQLNADYYRKRGNGHFMKRRWFYRISFYSSIARSII